VEAPRRFDWELATPDREGMRAADVAGVLDDGAAVPGLRSLLAVRNGVLIAERYYGGTTASDVLPVQSVTKSVCSMLVGQALQRGAIASLQAPLSALIPEALAQVPGSAAADITLVQILTGRSGLVYDWVTDSRPLADAPDPVRFALSRSSDPARPPGWSYNDAAVCLLAPLLARAEGLDLAALAARDLFAPLGIERFAWQRDRTGRPFAFGGLGLRTRDLAKLAWMMVDDGRWQGAAVVPPDWVAASTRAHGPAGWRVAPLSPLGYGYLWFTGTLHGRRVALAWGYGGQFALLVPQRKLAVVTAATAPRPDALGRQTAEVMALAARLVATAE
jgi:CubicO group peptidase (beta-lactamase class C family)